MEVLGAVAASVQLLDTALKTSRRAYGFFKSVKDAKENMRQLRISMHMPEEAS